jgi:hypothetical protein
MYKIAFAALIGAGALLAMPSTAHAQNYRRGEVTCSSQNNNYHSCRLPERGQARLVRQLSNNACVRGRTWGQKGNSSVWVSRGCRGVFGVIGDRRMGNDDHGWMRDRNYAVQCRANGRRTSCAWDNRYGNPYIIQRNSGACVDGRDWGYDSRGGLWVSSDCDARFGYH